MSPPVQVPQASLHNEHTPLLLNIPSPQDDTQTLAFKAEFSRQDRHVVPSLQSVQSVMQSSQIPLELNLPFGHPSKQDERLRTFPVAQVWHEFMSPPVQLVQATSQSSHFPEVELANLLFGQLKDINKRNFYL